MKRNLLFFISLITLSILAGCSKYPAFEYEEDKVNIIVTTTMLGDLTNNIGGDKINLKTLMGIGVDPHSYIPRPSVTNAVNIADLIITNGLELEAKMGKVLEIIDKDKSLVIGNYIDEKDILSDNHGAVDPHIWLNISNWKIAANVIKDKLIELDSKNQLYYELNAVNYINELDALEEYIINKISTLPEEKRVLITAHDGFSYFGKAYGFTVYSIQGISTQSEASVSDIKDLANVIVNYQVKAVFFESSIPEATIKSVINHAKILGHNVSVGGTIYSDSLGDNNSGADSYINMLKYNIDTIVNNLK